MRPRYRTNVALIGGQSIISSDRRWSVGSYHAAPFNPVNGNHAHTRGDPCMVTAGVK